MSRLERVIDLIDSMLEMTDRIFDPLEYRVPETVGTVVIKTTKKSSTRAEKDFVVIGLPNDEEGKLVDGLTTPTGWVREGETVELIVARGRVSAPNRYFVKRDKWMVAIRPYSEETYGKPISPGDKEMREMLRENRRQEELEDLDKGFYERFLKK